MAFAQDFRGLMKAVPTMAAPFSDSLRSMDRVREQARYQEQTDRQKEQDKAAAEALKAKQDQENVLFDITKKEFQAKQAAAEVSRAKQQALDKFAVSSDTAQDVALMAPGPNRPGEGRPGPAMPLQLEQARNIRQNLGAQGLMDARKMVNPPVVPVTGGIMRTDRNTGAQTFEPTAQASKSTHSNTIKDFMDTHDGRLPSEQEYKDWVQSTSGGASGVKPTGDLANYLFVKQQEDPNYDSTKDPNFSENYINFLEKKRGKNLSADERDEIRLKDHTQKVDAKIAADPVKYNKEYLSSNGKILVNRDGEIERDLDGNVIKLSNATGQYKRGIEKELAIMGNDYDDARQTWELLQDPEVKAYFNRFKETVPGLTGNKLVSAFTSWTQQQGLAKDSKVQTLISRIGRMASRERKTYAGTAVTSIELKSLLNWLVDPAEGYSGMVNKVRLAYSESEETFRRYVETKEGLGTYMYPYYKQYGLDKFGPILDLYGDPKTKEGAFTNGGPPINANTPPTADGIPTGYTVNIPVNSPSGSGIAQVPANEALKETDATLDFLRRQKR